MHVKPTNTLRSQLVHPKDKLEPGDKAGTVYHVQCGECSDHYVGETERQLKVRIGEHLKHKSSHVCQHLKRMDHTFSPTEDVSVLHTETDWFKRGVAESIHILRKRPTINKDKGRHILPPIYQEVLLAPGSRQVRSHNASNNNNRVTSPVTSPEEDGRIANESSTA